MLLLALAHAHGVLRAVEETVPVELKLVLGVGVGPVLALGTVLPRLGAGRVVDRHQVVHLLARPAVLVVAVLHVVVRAAAYRGKPVQDVLGLLQQRVLLVILNTPMHVYRLPYSNDYCKYVLLY